MPMEFTGLCMVTEILSGNCLNGLGNGLLRAQLWYQLEIPPPGDTTSIWCCFPHSQKTQVLFFDRVSLETRIGLECNLGRKYSRFEEEKVCHDHLGLWTCTRTRVEVK